MGVPAEVPELRQEIDRKAIETIEKIEKDFQNGRITRGQYAYAVDVLWSAYAGVVDKDFMFIMEQMGNSRQDGSFFTRHYLRDATGGVAVVTNLHDGRVRLQVTPLGQESPQIDKMFDFRPEVGTMKSAREKEMALIDGLINRGFQEI